MGKSPGKRLLGLTVLVFGIAVLQQSLSRGRAEPPHEPQPLPDLMTQGWLNTDEPPTRASLEGKWVIVSLWNLSCGTCRRESPLMARINKAISGRDDVVLLGFNTDPGDPPEEVRAYIDGVRGYDWPVGIGAPLMAEMMNAPYTPSLFLFAPNGQSVWRGHFAERLTKQLDKHLGIDSVQITRR